MLSIFSKQTVLTKASGNSRQEWLDVNGFLMGFELGNNFRVSPVNGYCFYFPASICVYANKEIGATKLYRLKNPWTIQDLCCENL